LTFIFLATAAQAEWKLISVQSEPSASKGIEHRYMVAEDSASGDRASLELAIFSTQSAHLRVIDQTDGPRAGLAEVMRRGKYVAGVNGGYFDPDYQPVGLLIVDGKIISPLRRARLLSGVLSSGGTKVQIWRFNEFPRSQKFDAAIGCGPMVVDLARPVSGLDASRGARRTFAAVERGDRAAIGFCSDVSLADLSRILVGGLGDFKIQRALNLDGGSSSAFWFKRKDGSAFSIAEQKSVRDFVGIVPK
jgi:hypothetical protein